MKKYSLQIIGLAVGGVAGWAYWKFVGCTSGSCPITSNPLHSSVYGAVMGILLFGMFKNENK